MPKAGAQARGAGCADARRGQLLFSPRPQDASFSAADCFLAAKPGMWQGRWWHGAGAGEDASLTQQDQGLVALLHDADATSTHWPPPLRSPAAPAREGKGVQGYPPARAQSSRVPRSRCAPH